MNRFFINRESIVDSTIVLYDEDASHISRVLRLKAGDSVELCDGMGKDYLGRITYAGKNNVDIDIIKTWPSQGEPKCYVCLYQGLPKGTKMDIIIQKCVELGVRRIVPVITERTVVKLYNRKDEERKVARWQKIALEAAKQSRRGIIPVISLPVEYHDVLKEKQYDKRLILWEKEKETSLKEELTKDNKLYDSVAVLIGPEGGFDESEIRAAIRTGWNTVSLGPRILRTETSGIAVLSTIMYQMEEMQWK